MRTGAGRPVPAALGRKAERSEAGVETGRGAEVRGVSPRAAAGAAGRKSTAVSVPSEAAASSPPGGRRCVQTLLRRVAPSLPHG